jgi:antitoxin (DNA-binding transcriptional repressor) of toxin-antitoxin stability system
LNRNLARVLDRVEMERETLLVTRGGRPMATLAPLSARPIDEQTPLVVVLTPMEQRILLKLEERAPHVVASFDDVGDEREVGIALSALEMDRLLERHFAGYGITERGRLVAAILRTRTGGD